MTTTADPRVDVYIASFPGWQQEICREVRALVHAADPEVTETMKRTKLSYFVLHGTRLRLLATEDHVNVFLYDGAIVPDPDGIITSSHENTTARTVAFREGQPIKTEPLVAMFRPSSPTTARVVGAGSKRRATSDQLRLVDDGVSERTR